MAKCVYFIQAFYSSCLYSFLSSIWWEPSFWYKTLLFHMPRTLLVLWNLKCKNLALFVLIFTSFQCSPFPAFFIFPSIKSNGFHSCEAILPRIVRYAIHIQFSDDGMQIHIQFSDESPILVNQDTCLGAVSIILFPWLWANEGAQQVTNTILS